MANYKQRLEKTEQRVNPDDDLRILWVNRGETADGVIAKAGSFSARMLVIGWEESDCNP
jgi:hypothetical protein